MVGDSSVIRSMLLERAGVRHGFSTRQGGVSRPPFDTLNLSHRVGDDPDRVSENLGRFASSIGFDPDRLFTVSQVHGRTVATLDASSRAEAFASLEADAILSDVPGTAVAVRTADCVPILLASIDSKAAAAVHAGWRGIVAGVVPFAVRALFEHHGIGPDRVLAAIGPCIGPCCYDVGSEVADAFAGAGLESAIIRSEAVRVDLGAAVRMQLLASGLDPAQVDGIEACTRCDPARFFSYRRDGEQSGRHLGCIVVR